MIVELRSFANGRTRTLIGTELRMFADELTATMKRPAGHGVGYAVAPDCSITVHRGKNKSEYLIFGRSVLQHVRTKRTWQFYFGLQILEWLS